MKKQSATTLANKLLLFTCATMLFITNAQPAPHGALSAIRYENESFAEAVARNLSTLTKTTGDKQKMLNSAYGKAKSLKHLRINNAPVWPETSAIEEAFIKIRDIRFLVDYNMPDFPRRLTWLYPDDGCYARAALMNTKLQEFGYVRPGKIFVFGELQATTNNNPNHYVKWWYHVVPVIAYKQQLFVFDPALNSQTPLPLMSWIAAMTDDPTSVKASICNSHTYQPRDNCFNPNTTEELNNATQDERYFLPREWQRLEILGRNPSNELGDFPPWLTMLFPRSI